MRSARVLLFLFIVFMFVPAVTVFDLTGYKIIGAILAVMIFTTLRARMHRSPLLNVYTVLMVIIFISGLLGGIAFGSVNLFYQQKMLLNIVLFVVVVETATTLLDLKLILAAISCGGMITVVSGLVQLFGMPSLQRIGGAMGNPNGYGQVCAQTGICLFGLSLLARKRSRRSMIFGLALLCVLGLLYSGSRGASVALLVGLVAFVGLGATRKAAVVFVLSGALVITLLAPEAFFKRWETAFRAANPNRPSALETRVELSRRGWETFRRYPLNGVGCGNVLEAMRRERYAVVLVTHNAFVQALAETGAMGFVAFSILVWLTIRGFYRVARSRRWGWFERMLAATFLALFVATVTGQSSSGNYIHAIWYILFGVGRNFISLVEAEIARLREHLQRTQLAEQAAQAETS